MLFVPIYDQYFRLGVLLFSLSHFFVPHFGMSAWCFEVH
jgi:hypothetical protein